MKENVSKTNINDSLLDAENFTSVIKEETKKTLKNLLGEAVKEYMNESILNEAEKSEEDDYEVEDVKDTADETDDATDSAEASDDVTSDEESSDVSDMESSDDSTDDLGDAESTDDLGDAENVDSTDDLEDKDEWSEFDQYKTDDGAYDFTGVEDDDTIVKVYKLLNDDDQVLIKKEDNKVNIKDNETGAEYVIELDPDDTDESMTDDSMDDDIDDSMNESIDLGYTDNYQDVDPMTNDGMSEPANKSVTKDWDKGVPSGAKKPWAGKGSGEPFSDKLTEEDDMEMGDNEIVDEVTTVTSNNARKMPKTHTSEPRKANLPYGSKHISAGGKYDDTVVEKILKKAKAIQEENKRYKDYLGEIKNRLQEAVVVNVSLGQIVKLFTENATSKSEKKSIVERFSNVKSVNECKTLYETISRELNKEQKANVVLEKQMTSSSSKINETPVYQSKDILEALDLMNRVNKLK